MNDTSTGIDEGYVKYVSHWTDGPPPAAKFVALLNEWRRPLFAAKLIGHYEEHKIGYGNISVRDGNSQQFVISGTQTGHIENTTGEHYTLVSETDIAGNTLSCIGPIQASSEALTHASLYALSNDIRAVVHVHSKTLWSRYKHVLPTTDASVAYGTSEMAHEFQRLWQHTDFPDRSIAMMAGHDEGIVSMGKTLREATLRVLNLST